MIQTVHRRVTVVKNQETDLKEQLTKDYCMDPMFYTVVIMVLMIVNRLIK